MNSETPIGFAESSLEFLSAASLVLSNAKGVSLPSYFLLGRSIELSLKAYLLHSGLPMTELRKRKYGHDLRALLHESISRGIENEVRIQEIEKGVIELLSYDYEGKRLEYRVTGGQYALPHIEVTCGVARKLALGLSDLCARGKLKIPVKK